MVGERLYDLRKEAGLTQDELAAVLHINKHSISAYEREKSEPPDALKIAIARYFNVSIDYLLGVTRDPNPHADQRNILRLSPNLPTSAKNSLSEFAEYLAYKYKKERHI